MEHSRLNIKGANEGQSDLALCQHCCECSVLDPCASPVSTGPIRESGSSLTGAEWSWMGEGVSGQGMAGPGTC